MINILLKRFLKEITPPILARSFHFMLEKMRLYVSIEKKYGKKNAEWYDMYYKKISEYRRHYSELENYFLWCVVSDRIAQAGITKIVDIGCGSGQFASLLYDKGLRDYCGIDFSSRAIEIAKSICPYFKFEVIDLMKGNFLQEVNYESVVALEFLEHVESDLEVIRQIRKGTKVYASVPNFPFISHVRYFENEQDVIERYQDYFLEFGVDSFIENSDRKTYFLIEGTKS